MSRRYRVRHETRYSYAEEVTESYGRAHLTPRDGGGQTVHEHRLDVVPGAEVVEGGLDHFGNRTTYLEVLRPHTELVVTATTRVEVHRRTPDLASAHLPVAAAAEAALVELAAADEQEALWAKEFRLPSPHIPLDESVARYAAESLSPSRPVGAAVVELIARLHADLAYRPGVTALTTTPQEVLVRREGVCQDFAHLAAGCLRAAGLPARYVSGYLETRPPPGEERRIGADASHAWVSVLLPGLGWVDLDPTNDQGADDGYVVLAWGRDYGDVTPLRGVIYTEGSASTMRVSVDVAREDEQRGGPDQQGEE